MNDVLTRVLQRAISPGGGLEPLRPSRTALRARAASAMIFPTEEMREVDVLRPATPRAAARMEMSSSPVAPSPVMISGEPLAQRNQRESVAPQPLQVRRQEQAAITAMPDVQLHEAATQHESAEIRMETPRDAVDSSREGKQSVFPEEHQEMKVMQPPVTVERAQTVAVPAVEEREPEEPTWMPTAPVLEISIGHIEVQAAVRAPERPRMPPFRPRVSLNDFLARSGRR